MYNLYSEVYVGFYVCLFVHVISFLNATVKYTYLYKLNKQCFISSANYIMYMCIVLIFNNKGNKCFLSSPLWPKCLPFFIYIYVTL